MLCANALCKHLAHSLKVFRCLALSSLLLFVGNTANSLGLHGGPQFMGTRNNSCFSFFVVWFMSLLPVPSGYTRIFVSHWKNRNAKTGMWAVFCLGLLFRAEAQHWSLFESVFASAALFVPRLASPLLASPTNIIPAGWPGLAWPRLGWASRVTVASAWGCFSVATN